MNTLLPLLQSLADRLRGKKTYLAALLFVGLAGLSAYQGDTQKSGELLTAALATLGLRHAVSTSSTPPTA